MTLLTTPLTDWHVEHGGRMVDFFGWSMPVQYSTIVAEHQATRNAAAVFDISHMARLRFIGERATDFLEHMLTRRVNKLKSGQIRYGLVTNQAGGILDDILVYCLAEQDQETRLRMVVNAGNRLKIIDHFNQHLAEFGDVTMIDETLESGMIAVQGPQALAAVQPLVPQDLQLAELKYYSGGITTVAGHSAVVSRTGYTGEDGCEIMLPAAAATEVWQRLVDAGVVPAGLGARDTLRLEAAMPLYGHELDETIDPYQAGLAFAVQLKERDFVGSQALRELSQQPPAKTRIGLTVDSRRVPREHCRVLKDGVDVGEVTSGTFSPTLDRPIAMAYVQREAAEAGTQLDVDVRGRQHQAEIVELPFYSRSS